MPDPIYFIPLVVVVGLIIADQVLRQRSFNKATAMYAEKRYRDLIDYLDSRYPRMFYPRFTRQHMLFKAYESLGDVKAAEETLGCLFACNPSKEQLTTSLVEAFTFYLKNERFDKARGAIERMEKFPELERVAPEMKTLYAIMAEGDSSHIEEMEAKLEKADAATEQRLCTLIAKQYENQGDTASAKRYRERAEKAA